MKQLNTKELQQHILSMMQDVHKFCMENDIQYSLEGGSLIGAIRHKGFIPWDDDMDIMMTRSNFEKFCKLFNHDNLSIAVPGQKGYYLRFARVFDNKNTIVMDHRIPFSDNETGMWIDIFPIDSAPECDQECNKIIKDCDSFKRYLLLFRHSLYKKKIFKSDISLRKKIKNILSYCRDKLKLVELRPTFSTIESMIAEDADCLIKYMDNKSKYNIGVCFAHNNYLNKYPKDWFCSYILVPFEDTQLSVLANYDDYLTMVFGDYMIIPPKEKQIVHSFYKVYWKK